MPCPEMSNEVTVICPLCMKENRKSKVIPYSPWLPYPAGFIDYPYYDEEGKWHNPEFKFYWWISYRCSNGHIWQERTSVPF
jgi:hypothetical protein